jgi:hypothetical protein
MSESSFSSNITFMNRLNNWNMTAVFAVIDSNDRDIELLLEIK